jgi:hypothetical protein
VKTGGLLALTVALVACAGPTSPRNRAGIAVAPGVAGAEIERFVDDDADSGSWSVGLTAGFVWDGVDALLETPRKQSASLLAINPLVRWHAWRATDWLTLGLDGKLSFLWLFPDRQAGRARFAMALESHASVAFDDRWVYGLAGVGVKQFLFRTDVERTRFPASMTVPAGELSVGLRW